MNRKLEQDLTPKEAKWSVVNQQCIVYHLSCDLCNADYVGYTTQQHIAEQNYLAIGKHLTEVHSSSDLLKESHFEIL